MTTPQPHQTPLSVSGASSEVPVRGGGSASHSFPRWIKLAVFLVCAGVIVSLAVSRERMADSLHLIRAEKMVKNQRWDEAYRSYQSLVPKHSGNTEVLLSYAEAAVHTGHHEDASRVLHALNGRLATSRQAARVGKVSAELERAGYRDSAASTTASLSLN